MQVTVSQLKSWYEDFSGVVFDYDMPYVNFIITNNRTQLGQALRRGTTYSIKVSNFYDFPEVQFRNTLLHEMCHIWCYYHGYRDEHHTGYHWKEIANKAYRKTGLLITRTIDMRDVKPAKHNEAKMEEIKAKKNAPAIIVDIDYGSYHFLVKTTKNILWSETDHKGELKSNAKVYICDNERFIRWQSSRSLHRGYKFANSEYLKDIKPILSKGLEVENLRDLCIFGEYDCLGIR